MHIPAKIILVIKKDKRIKKIMAMIKERNSNSAYRIDIPENVPSLRTP